MYSGRGRGNQLAKVTLGTVRDVAADVDALQAERRRTDAARKRQKKSLGLGSPFLCICFTVCVQVTCLV